VLSHSKQSIFDKLIAQTQKKISPEETREFSHFVEHFFAHKNEEALLKLIEREGLEFQFERLLQIYSHLNKVKPLKPYIESKSQGQSTIISVISYDCTHIVDTIILYFKNQGIKYQNILTSVMPVKLEQGKVRILPFHEMDANGENPGYTYVAVQSVLITRDLDLETKNRALLDLEEILGELFLVRERTISFAQVFEDIKSSILDKESFAAHKLRIQEAVDFFEWLNQGYFTLLGVRFVEAHSKMQSHNLGFFEIEKYRNSPDLDPRMPLNLKGLPKIYNIQKLLIRSRVYHDSRIVSLELPLLGEDKEEILGLYQIIGIFNSSFYKVSPFQIPALKNKVQRIFEKFNLNPSWRDAKLIRDLLEIVPNDELIFSKDAELIHLCQQLMFGVDKVAILTRQDEWGVHLAVQIFMPGEWYTQTVRDTLNDFLAQKFEGEITRSNAKLSDQEFTRLIFVISFKEKKYINIDNAALTSEILELIRSWADRFCGLTNEYLTPKAVRKIFPPVYQSLINPEEGVLDFGLGKHSLSQNRDIFNIRLKNEGLVIKFFSPQEKTSLTEIVQLFQTFGLEISNQERFQLNFLEGSIWLYDYYCPLPESMAKNLCQISELEKALQECWNGVYEVDPFNQLITKTNLKVEQVNVIRAYGMALKQMGIPFSMRYVAKVLGSHPQITQLLWQFFENRLNPIHTAPSDHARDKILKLLGEVSKLDEDRIIRKFVNIIRATVRTNAFLQGRHCLSFKFKSAEILDLPIPKPLYEIYIYSKTMEGCHLRAGKVARGGIRWSERPEDFRSEVLGLMKAQVTKNAVIVPTGSKGGFITKNLNGAQGDRNQMLEKITTAYKTFIRGILDVTDNLIEGEIVHPSGIVALDEKDPYLVVAADKGTSTFSDTANGLSKEYNFWLGDAFASGGSQGYDHKNMAITSRGAWISVKHHFGRMGINPGKDKISVVGVGDMSGDVFGNGMLRSKTIHLAAAFNHLHIFIDPSPDNLTECYKERLRLFNTPGSSWADYNSKLISKGGGVFLRTEKNIPLTSEIKKLLDIDSSNSSLTPDELIQHILKTSVDLIWFGGIGTYIRSSTESNRDVLDPQNDAIRIQANQIRAKIIGEGANLAVTSRARVEFALSGGLINTDALDNSAGVDCSDHEVNIKILLKPLLEQGVIKPDEREQLLRDMTEEVAELVLKDNEHQNKVLTLMEYESRKRKTDYLRLLEKLEQNPSLPLNRESEGLPSASTLNLRDLEGKFLTRPELCVILAYAKNTLKHMIMGQLDQTQFNQDLYAYFPVSLQEKFPKAINAFALKDELISTIIANKIINQFGPIFVFKVMEELGITPSRAVSLIDECLKNLALLKIEGWIEKMEENWRYNEISDFNIQLQKIITLMISIRLKVDCYNFQNQFEDYIQGLLKKSKLPELINLIPPLFMMSNIVCGRDEDKTPALLKQFDKMEKILSYAHLLDFVYLIPQEKSWKYELVKDLLFSVTQVFAHLVINFESLRVFSESNPGSSEILVTLEKINQTIMATAQSKAPGDISDLMYLDKILKQMS
jgi:glutamate dehydrogenase